MSLEEFVQSETYDKLLAVREKDDVKLPDCRFLRKEIETPSGRTETLRVRNYQIQMILHLLLMRRFVVGDATGIGKCVAGDTMIRTSQGLERIKDLAPEDTSPDTFYEADNLFIRLRGEEQGIEKVYDGGEKPTRNITTRSGYEVEGTLVHPILVRRDSEHQWIPLSQVQEGDYVCIDRSGGGFASVEPTMNTDVTCHPNADEYDFPEHMTPELARLMGYIVGEGMLGQEFFLTISQCPEENPDVHSDILRLTREVFGYEISSPDDKDKHIHSVHIRRLLSKNGLGYVGSRGRRIPDCIFKSTKNSVRNFLRGLFEGESSVSNGAIEFSTASRELGEQVQILLLEFGIVCSRSPKRVRGYDHTYWRLTITGDDVHRFRQSIGYVSEKRSSALDKGVGDRDFSNPNNDIIPNSKRMIEHARGMLMKAVTRTGANENRKGSGLKQFGRSFVSTLYNIRNIGRDPTYRFLRELYGHLEDRGIEHNALLEVLEADYYYDPVVSIKDATSHVYDLQVGSEEHAYVSNGIVSHNTLETIAALSYIWEREPEMRSIVVTNKTAMGQWEDEFEKFTTGPRPRLVEGTPEDRRDIYRWLFEEDWDPERPKVLITNYARTRNDEDFLLQYLEDPDDFSTLNEYNVTFVADECSALRNIDTKTHTSMRGIMRHCRRVWGLTATVIENRLQDAYGVFRAIFPNLFGNFYEFRDEFCQTYEMNIGSREVTKISGHTDEHIEKFKERIDPFYLGRAKHDVADELPSLTTREIRVPCNRRQWSLYEDAVEGIIELGEDVVHTTKLTKLIYTQQIVDHPCLIDSDYASAKEEALIDLMEDEFSGQKLIIYTRFRKMIDRLETRLRDEGFELGIDKVDGEWVATESKSDEYVRVTGKEDGEQRSAARRAFASPDGAQIILINDAAQKAINLQSASAMVFYDLPWSAGSYLQILGRMIRIGSEHDNVLAVHLIAEGPTGGETIDQIVSEVVDSKMELIEEVMGTRLEREEELAERLDTDDAVDRMFSAFFDKGG